MVRSRSVTFLCVTLSIAFGACDDGAAIHEHCGAIAEGGCPGNDLTICADPACAFVASCDVTRGLWTTVGACVGVDAGARDAGAGDAGAGDAALRDGAAAGGPSAACPALQLPDCAASTRAACGAGCCGCEDLFVCEAGGWTYVGTCAP